MAADGIEDLRRACGGHGYLMSSGIAPLEVDFKGPNTTAEGDYVVSFHEIKNCPSWYSWLYTTLCI